MQSLLTLSLADRFALIIQGLRLLVAAAAPRHAEQVLLTALHNRLRRISDRVRTLAARFAAGTLAPHRPPQGAPTPTARIPRAPDATPAPAPRTPGSRGWLLRAVPAAGLATVQLEALLADPAHQPILATEQARRLLRPLCRMLGVTLPPIPPTPTPPTPPPPSPVTHDTQLGAPEPCAPTPHGPLPQDSAPPKSPETRVDRATSTLLLFRFQNKYVDAQPLPPVVDRN